MSQAATIALIGAPNSGKSTLFNGLTGGRAKVANHPGVTVETRRGAFTTPGGRAVELLDLPGVYGLSARSVDARVSLDAIQGHLEGSAPPDVLLVVIDAALLRTHLQTVLQLQSLGRPVIVALNMMDLAERDGLGIDVARLETLLDAPVVASRATRKAGRAGLLARLDQELDRLTASPPPMSAAPSDIKSLQRRARAIADEAIVREAGLNRLTRRLDAVLLHPVAGVLILGLLLFFMFQAVFSWAGWPMDMIENGFAAVAAAAQQGLPNAWYRSLLVDGVLAGVGSVVIFLPQILILFAFILLLEASGYMARAAFLMDELMMRVGLNGRAFIPLLSSFACAIPGIMAARTLESERDRITTIMIAPLMTCSARWPVYTLIIAAFIPAQRVGWFNLQGLVAFGLLLSGVVSAMLVAYALKRTVAQGRSQPLIMELPTYKAPVLRDFLAELWRRAAAFLRRAGTIIFATSVILWFLASYPSSATSLRESYAGMIGGLLEPILKPIGFNLEIAIALVPGMAAREVAVGALGTVYAVSGGEDNVAGLEATLQSAWSLPTALAFLAWYVFAPQCFATLAVTRRETNSWRWTGFMFAYLMGLAYVAAGLVYWTARAAGL